MTKADFLQLLERALAQLPEEERQANLEYYSELLDDMLEEGMTEAEATAKLGSPSQIAQSILQEVPLGKLVSTRMKPKSGWRWWAALCGCRCCCWRQRWCCRCSCPSGHWAWRRWPLW